MWRRRGNQTPLNPFGSSTRNTRRSNNLCSTRLATMNCDQSQAALQMLLGRSGSNMNCAVGQNCAHQ